MIHVSLRQCSQNHKWCEEVENEEEILWPKGEPLTNVSGIELPRNAIGLSLQLVEFCCAFGKVLKLGLSL
jgi:hypothetical protein